LVTQAVSVSSIIRVSLVTGGLKLGGSTIFLCNFGGELARRGVPVDVVSFERENPLASDFARLKVPVSCEDASKTIFEDRLESTLRKLRSFMPTAVLATLSAQSFEVLRYVPQGVTRVGVGQSDDPAVYEMMRHYAPSMDFLAVVSQAMRERSSAMPEFRDVPVKLLPYGVPMPELGKVSREFKSPLRILYLGRLDREQKRVHLFPQILRDLKASGIAFHWTIVGDGPERESLQQEMRGSPPPQTVSFFGKADYSQVPGILAQNDIFLLASDYEGLPLSLLEAMGAGLVPVVTDVASGIREVVTDETGRRIAMQNVHGYAEAIVHLDRNRDLLRRLSQKAQSRVKEEFSIAAMTDRWLDALPKASASVKWPSAWRIQKPLVSSAWLRFSIPGRIARRALLRFAKR
jgi:glycosyltransferase involved in cell wall biosynthesis